MFFAYCFFLKQILSKMEHSFKKLNQLNFNELNVIGQFNCILYMLYIYLSLFILILNHSLSGGLSFLLQQLVGMAMTSWEYIPYQVSSRYPRC